MTYTVVIRTLGKAGVAYQTMLESLAKQTIKPSAIIVYIAEGYSLPEYTSDAEQYIYVKKGMVAQRALRYDEVKTEYILFLDDDIYLTSDAVEKLYTELLQHKAQVIAPCTFENHKVPTASKIRMTLMGKEVCRLWGDNRYAYKVFKTAGFSYNNTPAKAVYESTTNAGNCFFCRKEDFLKIDYIDEIWLDKSFYALPDDQVMFYKMHKCGLKILTSFDSGIVHLDAGTTLMNSEERMYKLIYSEFRNKLIFWHRFLYLPERSWLMRMWAVMCISYAYGLQVIKYILFYLLGRKDAARAFFSGIKDAVRYIQSKEYGQLPLI